MREDPKPEILWTLHYTQYYTVPSVTNSDSSDEVSSPGSENRILQLPDVALDLAVEDSVLENVKQVWREIVGTVAGEEFLMFEDRDVMGEDEEDDQDSN